MLEKLPESLGRALQRQRSGMDSTAFRQLLARREVPHVLVRSSAFDNMGAIPARFTADGEGISPPLEWSAAPAEARLAVLMVEDADSPTPHPLVHAIAIAGAASSLAIGALPHGDHEGDGVKMGLNSFLKRCWLPPDPPPGHGIHRYVFQIFSLAGAGILESGLGRHDVIQVILERAVAAGCLVGTYERLRRERTEERETVDARDMTDVAAAALA